MSVGAYSINEDGRLKGEINPADNRTPINQSVESGEEDIVEDEEFSKRNNGRGRRHRRSRKPVAMDTIGNLMKEKKKDKTCWERFIFYPTDKFKIYWDLVIIIFSIWNSILIPYELAYPETVKSAGPIAIIDYFPIDASFIADIVINFRTVYFDPRTETIVSDPGKIA
jgi:hypothetical protein